MTPNVMVRRCVARDFFAPIALIARNVRRRAMAFAVGDVVAFLEFKELYKLLIAKIAVHLRLANAPGRR